MAEFQNKYLGSSYTKSMMSNFLIIGVVILIFIHDSNISNATEPSSAEIPLWENTPSNSKVINEKEIIIERGKNGIVDRSFSNVHIPTLTMIQPEKKTSQPRPAFIICPGGGFSRVVLDKEGIDFAKFLNQHGIVGITLKYRTLQSKKHWYGISAPEADVKRAIRLARANANKWNLDPNRIGVFGFSAGGFIAATAATHHEEGNKQDSDPVNHYSSKPDFLGLAYPVLSMQVGISSDRYREMLFGKNNQNLNKLIQYYSNEFQVNSKTPPTFLSHAKDDSGVTVKNSEMFKKACDEAGVECTAFICDVGGHGFGVRDQGNRINQWKYKLIEWMKNQKIIK